MSLAICKHHLLDLGYDPNSPTIPPQLKTRCEIEGCDNSAKYLIDENQVGNKND